MKSNPATLFINMNFEGRAIRLALLSTHYKKPLDWNEKLLEDSRKALFKFYTAVGNEPLEEIEDKEFCEALYDDLNTPKAISRLHVLAKTGEKEKLWHSLNLIGLGL